MGSDLGCTDSGVEMAQVESSLTPAQRETLSSLRKLQDEQASLSAYFEAAVLKLKLEYDAKYKPIYDQRRDLLLKGADGEAQGEGADPPSGTPVRPLSLHAANSYAAPDMGTACMHACGVSSARLSSERALLLRACLRSGCAR